MPTAPKQIIKAFSGWKIVLAVLFGISVSIYLLTDDFSISNYQKLHLGYVSILFLILAVLFEAIRDIAYMYRIHIMTDGVINWRKSFDVIMLWEFASALTPSVVGGSAVALFIVNKEINNAGKATAIVMITALLDELFYIIMVPLVFIIVGSQKLFISTEFNLFSFGQFPTKTIVYTGYGFILLLTSVIVFAIFFKPRLFKSILHAIFSFPFLKRWRNNVDQTGDDIITTSREMKGKDLIFWIKVFSATMVSWIARFAVINALIMVLIGHGDQLLIFGRQLIMWVILLISPTPGGSGVAEFMLPKFLGEFMNPYSHEIALTWRLLSYYSYLIIGSIVLPIWLRRVYKKSK